MTLETQNTLLQLLNDGRPHPRGELETAVQAMCGERPYTTLSRDLRTLRQNGWRIAYSRRKGVVGYYLQHPSRVEQLPQWSEPLNRHYTSPPFEALSPENCRDGSRPSLSSRNAACYWPKTKLVGWPNRPIRMDCLSRPIRVGDPMSTPYEQHAFGSVIDVLEAVGATYAIWGGVAVAVYGEPRFTRHFARDSVPIPVVKRLQNPVS
ncbi:MAG: hypothetical protein IPL28_09810 [Chloroflexi bacterium]|nr:hypothetical protein [Chloroflexota bacterium]